MRPFNATVDILILVKAYFSIVTVAFCMLISQLFTLVVRMRGCRLQLSIWHCAKSRRESPPGWWIEWLLEALMRKEKKKTITCKGYTSGVCLIFVIVSVIYSGFYWRLKPNGCTKVVALIMVTLNGHSYAEILRIRVAKFVCKWDFLYFFFI